MDNPIIHDLIVSLILWVPTAGVTTWFWKHAISDISLRVFLWIALFSFVPLVNMLFLIVFGGYFILCMLGKLIEWVCRKYNIDLDKKIL